MSTPSLLVIGGGPAGLRAAEVACGRGARVTLCDGQLSVGRKFLIAGRGGLNLTHGEPVENFPLRYGEEKERWKNLLGTFAPDDLRAWASELGFETYVGSSGRVFPKGQKAAGLLRAWVRRLREEGVEFQMGRKWIHLEREGECWRADFTESKSVRATALILALGGASWPETGSDGNWPSILAAQGVGIAPWAAANCGWEVDWPNELLRLAEGLPLKNISVRAGDVTIAGELLITRYGLEGGAIYRLGPILRAMSRPEIVIDLKPQSPRVSEQTKLSVAARALLECYPGQEPKNFRLALVGPRPIAEAISSAGGIRWAELDENLMLRKLPGVFAAGEMIDWEAPTGGYLLQGCFATGTRAGQAAFDFALTHGAGGSP